MGLGRMTGFAQLKEISISKDSEGFSVKSENTLASFRCFREGRHGSRKWADLAAFTDATDLFRFRSIPGVTVRSGQVLVFDGDRCEIYSVEDVNGRGMYIEALAGKVVSENGRNTAEASE